MKKSLPPLTLVLGGASSGKSSFAEGLAVITGAPRHYIATAQAFDAEMKAKITDHQRDRGTDWTTHEAPLDVRPALQATSPDDVVLLDCATMWLSNHLLAESDVAQQSDSLLTSLSDCKAPVIVVSNEVGHGIVPDNKLAREFRNAQGRLNIALATQAGLVVFVTAGLPQVLKGTLP